MKEHHEILKGDGEDGKINRIPVKERRPPKDKGKIPENTKDQKIPQDLPRRNVIDAANRHIKERNVQLLTPLAGNVRIVVITLQNEKAKSLFRSTTKDKMEIPT